MNVPTFSSDGTRLRNHNRVALEKMAAAGRVSVERNRAGLIVCATMRAVDGSSQIRQSAHLGQSYSYEQKLPSGHRAWTHTRLCDTSELTETEAADAELFVRHCFLAVRLSIASKKRKRRLAPVVSIDSARQAKKELAPVLCIADYRDRTGKRSASQASRPIEFDSERRAA